MISLKIKLKIFLHDKSNILKNISSDRKSETSSTIIAKTGIVEEKLVLFNGLNFESKENTQNDIIKFEQIDIDLRNLENTTIKQPKIQETSTLRLFSCIYNKFSKDPICKGGFNEDLPTLNRRMVLPLFIPVITLISSLLFIKTSGEFIYKVSIFAYSF